MTPALLIEWANKNLPDIFLLDEDFPHRAVYWRGDIQGFARIIRARASLAYMYVEADDDDKMSYAAVAFLHDGVFHAFRVGKPREALEILTQFDTAQGDSEAGQTMSSLLKEYDSKLAARLRSEDRSALVNAIIEHARNDESRSGGKLDRHFFDIMDYLTTVGGYPDPYQDFPETDFDPLDKLPLSKALFNEIEAAALKAFIELEERVVDDIIPQCESWGRELGLKSLSKDNLAVFLRKQKVVLSGDAEKRLRQEVGVLLKVRK